MQNTVVQQLESGLWDMVTYSPLLDTAVTVLAIAIPLCFRKIRDKLVKLGKDFISNHKHHHLPEPEDLARYYSIDSMLAVMQDNTQTDRVSICQFHNGESFSVQNPIFKFTCSHEFLSPGVRPASDPVKRLIVSNYLDLIGPLYSDNYLSTGITKFDTSSSGLSCNADEIRIIRYETGKMKFSATRYLFESLGVDVMYSIPMHDNKGKLIGAINFQYLNQITDTFAQVDLKDLCDKAMRVQYTLNSY
jgi:hypothetical protein